MNIEREIEELNKDIDTIDKLHVGMMIKKDNNEQIKNIEYKILHKVGISFFDKVIKLLSDELIKLHVICCDKGISDEYISDYIVIYYRKRNSDNSKYHFGCLFYLDDFIGRDRYLINRLKTMDPKYNNYIELYDILGNKIED